MSRVPISAVIPNRDGADLLRRTLPPLLRELPTPENEVVVIDDASTDGSVEMLREEFPAVRAIALSENVGFGAACNLGMSEARHSLVLLLNSDMEVTPGSVAMLRQHLDDPQVFAAGPEYRNPDPSWRAPEHEQARPSYMLGAPAGGGLFRREVFLELGGFDPLYAPFYWEDFDLGWVAWRHGWKVVFEPRCHFWHLESATIRKLFPAGYIERIRTRNRCLFGWKNLLDPWILARFQARSLLRGISGVLRRHSCASLLGVLDSLPRVPAALRRRHLPPDGRGDWAILRETNTSLELLQQL